MPEAPRVRLRDATLDDAALLESWDTPANLGAFNDFGLERRGTFQEALARGPLRSAQKGTLIVERVSDGRPIGSVSWHTVSYGPDDASRAYNIGIALIPKARGQGLGGEAQRALAAELFATTAIDRVEASTDVENLPEQRALEKAGFIREGIQRGAQYRAGARHDIVTYSRLRTDP